MIEQARNRLVFEEFFSMQLNLALLRKENNKNSSIKLEIKENTLQGRHIWKRTSFPKRKEKPVAIIYGKMEDKPFSSIILSYDNSLTLFTEESIKRFDKIQWIVEESNTIRITDQRNIDIKASIFSSVHEKQGPLRKARSFRYALFSGSILNKTIMESVGYLEYPDRL